MDFFDYQIAAGRTQNSDLDPSLQLSIYCLGLGGEAGEVQELIKKHLGHGHELDLTKVQKELGDVLWYISAIANSLGIPLNTIAEANIAKLKERYPDGFSNERSQAVDRSDS